MNIQIKPIESQQIWDEYIEKTKPKTFLQTWEWGSFNEKLGHKIFRLGVYNDQELIGVALLIKEEAKRGSFLLCPHGPLIDWQNKDVVENLLNHIKDLAKKESVGFIRFCSMAQDKKIFQELGFKDAPMHMHPELAWILDLSPDENKLLKDMRKNCRYAIKKAQKDGVEVEMIDDVSGVEKFDNIYGETAERQHFTPFSKNYVQKEFETFKEKKEVLFFFGKYKDEVISGAMVIFCNGSAFYHHGASIHKYPKIATSQIVQWAAIREAKKKGMKYYNFWGIAPEDQPKHPFAGITLFKKGFGGFSEEYVHAQDYVISPKYWFNYIIETLRKYKRGF